MPEREPSHQRWPVLHMYCVILDSAGAEVWRWWGGRGPIYLFHPFSVCHWLVLSVLLGNSSMRKLGDLPAMVPVHLTSRMAMQVADTTAGRLLKRKTMPQWFCCAALCCMIPVSAFDQWLSLPFVILVCETSMLHEKTWAVNHLVESTGRLHMFPAISGEFPASGSCPGLWNVMECHYCAVGLVHVSCLVESSRIDGFFAAGLEAYS